MYLAVTVQFTTKLSVFGQLLENDHFASLHAPKNQGFWRLLQEVNLQEVFVIPGSTSNDLGFLEWIECKKVVAAKEKTCKKNEYLLLRGVLM